MPIETLAKFHFMVLKLPGNFEKTHMNRNRSDKKKGPHNSKTNDDEHAATKNINLNLLYEVGRYVKL